jgi:hypothetical protein
MAAPQQQKNPFLGFIASRKTIAAMFATLLIGIPLWFGWSGWTQQERQSAVTHAIYAVAGVWGIHIGSNAYEDGKEKSIPLDTQVNVGSDVKNNVPSDGGAAPDPAPAPLTADDVKRITDERVIALAKKARNQIADGQAVLAAIGQQQQQTPSPLGGVQG